MKLEALNGFLRANPKGTVNEVSLQGGHSYFEPTMEMLNGPLAVKMALKRGMKRKARKLERQDKRENRRLARQEAREQRRLRRQDQGIEMPSELQQARMSRQASRRGRRAEGILTNQQVKDARRQFRTIKKLSKFGLNGSEAGFIRNAIGGSGMSVETLNGMALQGKKERKAERERKRKERKAKRDRAKKLRAEAKEKRLQKRIKRRELTGQERRTKRREERRTKRAERQAQRQEARADRQQKRRDDRLARQQARQEAKAERQRQRQEARGDGPLANLGDKLSDITGNIFDRGDDSELRSGGGGDSGGGGFFDSAGGGAIADFVEDQTGIDLASDEDILEQRDEQEKQKAMLPIIIGAGLVGGYLLYNQSKKKKGKKRK